jgi:hypothetical protein
LRVSSEARLRLCGAIAVALVLGRSYALLAYEQLDFDSDQAIVGLMAKHLSELRAFPLFFYGQDYMLGVQSWIAAPFFRLGGPTLAMLRLPLVIINCVVAVWLLRRIAQTVDSPWLALAAVLPFAATTPVMSAELLETLGASVEPFLYVLLLWALRNRPVGFGLVLALGFLHREFTIFAVPALAAATWWRTRRLTIDRRWLARMVCGFAAVWLVVDQLKRRINLFGPSGGVTASAPLVTELQSLVSRLVLAPASVLPKLRQAITECLPDMLGARTVDPLRYNLNASEVVGSSIIGIALVCAAVICVLRLAALWKARAADGIRSPSPFCVYMATIGAQALLAYSLSDAVVPGMPPILRYAFLALFLPIALVTALFEVDRRARYRAAVALLLALCAVLNLRDNLRIVAQYRSSPPPNEHRVLADDLVAHRIRYGAADYWDAYVTGFLARERVVLASTGKVRISAYQARVASQGATAVQILRQPCGGGRTVASWCIVDPWKR